MRIVCFLFDPQVGGPHVRARGVYQVLQKQGHDIRIAIPPGPGNAQGYHEEVGIAVDRPAIRKPVSPRKVGAFLCYMLALPLGVLRVLHYLRAQRADVVHVNGAFDLAPAFAAYLSKASLVWHLNDTAIPPRLAQAFGRMVSALADETVVAAEAVGRHYGLHPDGVRVIPAPVDISRFPARHRQAPFSTPVRVGLIANWNPLKGQDRFIDVIERLVARGHDVHAVLVGQTTDNQEPYWRPLHERITMSPLASRFTLVDYTSEVPALLVEWDVALLTSRSEASPMSVIEAMAVGLPQVCFQVGGVDELLGTTRGDRAGISVPEGDVEAMVSAVERLLTDPALYEAFSKAGPVRAQEHFSLDACVARHLAAYDAATQSKERVA